MGEDFKIKRNQGLRQTTHRWIINFNHCHESSTSYGFISAEKLLTIHEHAIQLNCGYNAIQKMDKYLGYRKVRVKK